MEGKSIRDIDYLGYPSRRIRVSDFIPIRDQSGMQELAWAGSLTGSVVTIDLEKASDSVPWDLIRYLFPSQWVAALDAVRSTALYYGDTFRIDKPNMAFPMGSSVCFPIESIVFWDKRDPRFLVTIVSFEGTRLWLVTWDIVN
jgi:hypothetical protein